MQAPSPSHARGEDDSLFASVVPAPAAKPEGASSPVQETPATPPIEHDTDEKAAEDEKADMVEWVEREYLRLMLEMENELEKKPT